MNYRGVTYSSFPLLSIYNCVYTIVPIFLWEKERTLIYLSINLKHDM